MKRRTRDWVATLVIAAFLFAFFTTRSRQTTINANTTQYYDTRAHEYIVNGEKRINTTSLFEQQDASLDSRLMRKAFPKTVYDVKILPFFQRKRKTYHAETITLITWVTTDRFHKLPKLVQGFRGPMSIVVYIPSDEQTASTHLQELEQVIAANPSISDHVDIHLVTATRLSLHNRWRNVARAFATTEWVLLWDADFEPCTDYQEAFERFRRMSGSKREWANRLEAGNAALVIPSFEWVDPKHDHGLCPRGKEELAKHYEAMTIDAFESENPRLSHATNYARFLQRSTDEPYEVEIDDFEFVYEVYAIFRQNIDVWADERFAGFGPDRSAFTASMWLSGMDLYVLHDQWAVHEPHHIEEKTRTSVENTVAWYTFRLDLCHSVADGLALQGKLHREAGNRVREICKDPTMPLLERDMMRLSMASVVVQDSRNRI